MPRYTARGAPRAVPARVPVPEEDGQAVLPLRDPARHVREPLLPRADHRDGDPLALGVRSGAGQPDGRALGWHARRRLRGPGRFRAWRSTTRGRSGTSSSSSSCCASSRRRRAAPLRDDHHPDAVDDPAHLLALPRPAARAPAVEVADRPGHRRGRADRPADPHVVRIEGAGRGRGVTHPGRRPSQRTAARPVTRWRTPARAATSVRTSTTRSRRTTSRSTSSPTAAAPCPPSRRRA